MFDQPGPTEFNCPLPQPLPRIYAIHDVSSEAFVAASRFLNRLSRKNILTLLLKFFCETEIKPAGRSSQIAKGKTDLFKR
jgi:hypothetical protein